jgi:hypothetical protein
VLLGDELASFLKSLEPDASITSSEREAFLQPLTEGEDVEMPKVEGRRRPVRRKAA